MQRVQPRFDQKVYVLALRLAWFIVCSAAIAPFAEKSLDSHVTAVDGTVCGGSTEAVDYSSMFLRWP